MEPTTTTTAAIARIIIVAAVGVVIVGFPWARIIRRIAAVPGMRTAVRSLCLIAVRGIILVRICTGIVRIRANGRIIIVIRIIIIVIVLHCDDWRRGRR